MRRLSYLLTASNINKHRRFGCEHYSTCLDYAAKMNWKSFSCYGCNGKPHKETLVVEIDGVPVTFFVGRLHGKSVKNFFV